MSSLNGAQSEGDHSRPAATVDVARSAALLRKARDGDRAAYGQIIELFQDRLFNAILRMVGDPEEARELTQEAFTRGLEKIVSFRGDAAPYTWLFRIGINLAISNLRRSGRRRTFSLDGSVVPSSNGAAEGDDHASSLRDKIASAGVGPLQAMEARERSQVVLDALGCLDSEYRAVLVMRDIEGFDYQQMADVLGLPLGTLKSRLFRARLALREELAPYLSSGSKRPAK